MASAQVFISQSQDFTFTPTGSVPLVFDKYNGLLSAVSNIYIEINYSKVGGSLFIDNDSNSIGSGNISQTVTLTLSSSDVALINGTFQPIGSNISASSIYAASVGIDDGDTDMILFNNDGYQSGGVDHDGAIFSTPVSTSGSGNVNSLVWSQYVGAGNFTINVGGSQSLDTSAISGVAGTFTPASAEGTVTVIYAVPEPSSALLVGMASIGLMFRRRRR
jgi:hypothetical protein